MKSSKIGYLIKEGLKSIVTHGFMSFASVTIIVACLVIMGSFTLIAVNIDAMLDDLEADNVMVAYVEETLPQEEARALQPQIEGLANVRSCEFETREQAFEEFVSQHEGQSAFQSLPAEVLRDRFIIYLEDISLMEQTEEQVRQVVGVARVRADTKVAEGFMNVRNVVSAVSLILVVVLVVVSVFIMSNTVKLATVSRKDEIAIMKMVGASNWFIRFPFVVEGLVLGLFGGLLAFLLEWAVYDIMTGQILSLLGNLLTVIPFASISAVVLLVYLGVGLVVGVFGSSIAIRNYLQV